MKTDWEVKTLGEVFDVRDGTHDSPKYQEIGFPLVTSKNLKCGLINFDNVNYISEEDYLKINNRSKVHKGDILFAMIGTIGNPVVVKEDPNFAIKNVALFKVPSTQSSYFLKHYLDSKLVIEKMTLDAKGTTQKFVGLGYLRSFPIPLPPLSEQHRIVAILDEAFVAIDKAKANAEINLKNARELFESYLQSVFANPSEEWEARSLEEVCGISSKLIDPRNKEFLNVLHVGGANIESVTGKLLDLKTAQEEGLISGKFLFDESMVLYSKIRPYLMKVAKPNFQGLCSADIYPLSPFKGKMIRDYLFYLLLSPDFTQYAIKGSARAGMPKLNREHLFEYKFYLGSITNQTSIVEKLDALSIETKKLEVIYRQKLTDLDELKKAILQKAFQGELSKTQGVALCD